MNDNDFAAFVYKVWEELRKEPRTMAEIKYLQYVARLELAKEKFKKDLDSEEE